jgi:putative hydrolase of the HAD superfamily
MLTFVFDLDDTLIETNAVFLAAEQSFFDEMVALGFDGGVARKTFIEIETRNVARFGFMPVRFYTSLAETYDAMCQNSNREIEPATRTRIEQIGKGVFIQNYRVLDGVFGVLDALEKRGDRLLMWTRGDSDIQLSKLAATGLEKYFGRPYILAKKTSADLLNIVRNTGLVLSSTWVVGDSVRSDINPALEAGANAIWIPIESAWRYEDAAPVADTFIKLNNIAELLDVYPTLLVRSRQ